MAYQQPLISQSSKGKNALKRWVFIAISLILIVGFVSLFAAWRAGTLTVKVNSQKETRVVNTALGISYVIPEGYEQRGKQQNPEGSEYIGSVFTQYDFKEDYHGRPVLVVTKITPSYGGDAVEQSANIIDAVRSLPETRAYSNDCQFESERWTTWEGPNLPGALYSAICRFKDGKVSHEGTSYVTFAVALVGHPGARWQIDGSSIDYRPADEFGILFLARSMKQINN